MSSDSFFISNDTQELSEDCKFSDASRIYSNGRSTLYKASREGKTFLLKAASDDSERLKQMIRREWEISMRCSHPNIAHVYAFENCTSVGDCIVMEYIEGRTLREFIKEKPELKLRKRVLMQLLSAISYIHSKGIVHNDIKPENIMISRTDNDLKLIDFGLADDDIHQMGKACGLSQFYCSPELVDAVFNGGTAPDSRSDIFSIGVIIGELFPRYRYTFIASKCKRGTPDRRYGNVDAIIKAINRYERMPLVAALAILILCMTEVICYQTERIHAMSGQIRQLELEREEIKLKEKNIKDSRQNVIREIDQWIRDITVSTRKSIKEKGSQQAFTEFCYEYDKFFNKIMKECEPSVWESVRRYMVAEMTECRDSVLFR